MSAGGVSSAGMLMIYDFNARALDALLPKGARLLDLGVGSGRAISYLVRYRPASTSQEALFTVINFDREISMKWTWSHGFDRHVSTDL